MPNFAFIDFTAPKLVNRPYTRLMTKIKIENYKAKFPEIEKLLTPNNNDLIMSDANCLFANFINKFIDTLNENFPLVKLSRQKAKNNLKPHITTAIRISINDRNKLYKKYLENKTECNHNKWITKRNNVTNIIKASQIDHVKKLLEERGNESKRLSGIYLVRYLITNKKAYPK